MSEPTERDWLEGLRYEDKFPEAGDGGRAPDVSEQRAGHEAGVEAVLQLLTFGQPTARQEHLIREAIEAYHARVFDGPASVLAALLAESPEATVAAIEALLTSDEAVEVATRLIFGTPTRSAARQLVGEALSSACRSLLSKAPKEGRDA